jgi:hypothetical protein
MFENCLATKSYIDGGPSSKHFPHFLFQSDFLELFVLQVLLVNGEMEELISRCGSWNW